MRYCWDSDKLDKLGDGAVTMDEESDIEDTGDGSPRSEAGVGVSGVDTTRVSVGSIVVTGDN